MHALQVWMALSLDCTHCVKCSESAVPGLQVEARDGLVLCTFAHAAHGLRWALHSMRECLHVDWPEELMHCGMADEVRGIKGCLNSGLIEL